MRSLKNTERTTSNTGPVSAPHQLRRVLITYLALALLDLLHHVHARFALGDELALHAALVGIVLTPITLAMYCLYAYKKKTGFIVIFLVLVSLASLMPGIYHGGFYHIGGFVKATVSPDPASSISILLPNGSHHHWFYEITGVVEFVLSVFCLYFIYVYLISNPIKIKK